VGPYLADPRGVSQHFSPIHTSNRTIMWPTRKNGRNAYAHLLCTALRRGRPLVGTKQKCKNGPRSSVSDPERTIYVGRLAVLFGG